MSSRIYSDKGPWCPGCGDPSPVRGQPCDLCIAERTPVCQSVRPIVGSLRERYPAIGAVDRMREAQAVADAIQAMPRQDAGIAYTLADMAGRLPPT